MDGRGENAELEVHELLDFPPSAGLSVIFPGSSRGNLVTAQLLDGKSLAERIRRQIAEESAAFVARTGVVPGLTVVLVGDDPASQVYVRNKAAASKAAGMNGHVLRLPATRLRNANCSQPSTG